MPNNDAGIRTDLNYCCLAMRMDSILLVTNSLQYVEIIFTILGGKWTVVLLYFLQ
jgi:hypothetical protein